MARNEEHVTAADVVAAIQSELPIPTTASEVPVTGVLGLCVNLATIVRHDEEDPIELILRAFNGSGIESHCFPGAHERESVRLKEIETEKNGVSIHRFQLYLPKPLSNQAQGLQILQQLQV